MPTTDEPKQRQTKAMGKMQPRRGISACVRTYRVELLTIAAGLAAINAIFISRAFRQTHTINPESAAQLGSFVGGYIGSLFALIGVVLLYSTLKNQRAASERQDFETKYFELLKMHRENVASLDIRGLYGVNGIRLFVPMFYELRSGLEILLGVAHRMGQKLTKERALSAAFCCFFFGTGPNSSRMLRMYLTDLDPSFVSAFDNDLKALDTARNLESGLGYVPFEGHQSRLGHYYRHLYQMVRYVDKQTIEIDKYEYVKTIRAQLSTHEQALLLVNSLTPMGKDWWDKGLIVKYRLVQNIPCDFFDPATELDLRQVFPLGYFEWEEMQRLSTQSQPPLT